MKNTELKIDGMTCGHCVASVTKALKSVPGVESATVNLSEGTASVTHSEATCLPALIAAVKEEGYGAEEGPSGATCETDALGGAACSCCAS